MESREENIQRMVESREQYLKKCRRLRVYYGIGKVSGLRKKRSIEIFFENSPMDDRMKRVRGGAIQTLAYTRDQTEEEQKDALYHNRVWHVYTFFIDEKPFNGSLDRLLWQMEREEAPSVSKAKRKEMVKALREAWMRQYSSYKEPKSPQLKLF